MLDVHLAQRHVKVLANFFSHVARLCAGKNFNGMDR